MRPSLITFTQRGIEQIRKHGLRLLWYRYVQRARILRTKPTPCPDDAEIELHTLVCKRDWLNGVWSLKSFRVAAGAPFRLIVHSDGSLSPKQLASLRHHFPGALFATREATRADLGRIAADCPRLISIWEQGRYPGLSRIVDAVSLSRRPTYFSVDPDVLFFDRPHEMLQRTAEQDALFGGFNVERTKENNDGLYCVDEKALLAKFGIRLPTGFNFGLGWMHREKFDWCLLNEILTTVPFDDSYFFVLDQTLAAIMCAVKGYVRLPVDRYVVEPIESLRQVAARHYYARTRDLLYSEGIATLLKRGFLRTVDGL